MVEGEENMSNNFQRINAISNAHVGKDFEDIIKDIFNDMGVIVRKGISVNIGHVFKKPHRFDLGNVSENNKIVIECKSHTWTSGDNTPSAKLTVWNEAMYYFTLTPNEYRKVLVVKKDYSIKRNETLGQYYIRTYKHLIPDNVEIYELNEETLDMIRIK